MSTKSKNHDVAVFEPYNFKKGQKIRIQGSKRRGDWEVIHLEENRMTLKCPISGKELTCDRFCFFLEEKQNEPWPGI